MTATPAALGFTVKSGWASAVVLAGTAARPELVAAARLELSDPADADARQPYHDGFATMREEGQALTRLLASVNAFGRREVRSGVILDACEGEDLPRLIVRERDLFQQARTTLRMLEAHIGNRLAGMGKDRDGPWRAEHKMAALGAWLVLAGGVK